MMKNASGQSAENRRFQIALAISLSLHAAVLWKFGMPPPRSPGTHSGLLEVRLAAPAAKFEAPVEVLETILPEGMPAPQQVRSAADDPVQVSTAAATPKVEAQVQAVVPPSNASSAATAKEVSSQPVGLPRSGPAGAPRRVEIEFDIFSGTERQLVGKGRHVYVTSDDRVYAINVKQTDAPEGSEREKPWELLISGQVGRQGLSPALFQIKGNLPQGLTALKEDSPSASAVASRTVEGRMPEGVVDRQSLIYQFMLAPPSPNGGKLWLSDGAGGAPYTYRVDGYETLVVPSLGNIQTMKLVFSAAGNAEIIELWLIPDKRYLPAKMRRTDGRGVITEQVVVSLESN